MARIAYEANALPEDSVPTWTRTSAGAPVRSATNSIFDTSCGPGESDEYRFTGFMPKGILDCRMLYTLVAAIGTSSFGCLEASTGKIVAFRGTADVSLVVGGNSGTLVSGTPSALQAYRLVWRIGGGGLPTAVMTDDLGNQVSVTSDTAFTPDRLFFRAIPIGAGTATLKVDYFRARIGSAGQNRAPRVGG